MFFTNCGYSISAIATSEEFQVIKKGFFGKDEIKLNAYFVSSDGKKSDEIIGNVNEKVKMVLEVTPQVEGVLKNGTIRFVPSEDEKLNFKLFGTLEDKIEEAKELANIETETPEEQEKQENTESTENKQNQIQQK